MAFTTGRIASRSSSSTWAVAPSTCRWSRCFDGVVEVRASAGDNRLGGEDFNDVVMRLARETIDPADGLAGGARADRFEAVWRAAAERCRRTLSEAEEALFRIVWVGKEH